MRRRILPLVLVMAATSFCACSGSLFKVKPVTQLPPLPSDSHSADAGGVTIKVGQMLADDESQRLFEANLPLSGILAVRTELSFQSGQPVELKRVRFRLSDDRGREWKLLTTKKAVSRILKANDVYAYNPNSRKQFTEEFGAYALDLHGLLSESDPRRTGFVFFESPNKGPVESTQRFTLTVERLSQPVSIPLN